MSNRMVVNSLLLMIISTIIVADQTIHRIFYKLDDDITWLKISEVVQVELTFIDSINGQSTLEIEAEKWVHDCCLQITTKPRFSLSLKQNGYSYLKVTAYFRLRKPLSYIRLNDATNLIMKNHMKAKDFFVELYDASKAQMKIQLTGDLHVSMSDASRLVMDGFVIGATSINVHDAARFDGRSCNINSKIVNVDDAGVAYLMDGKYTRRTNSQNESRHIKDSEEHEDLFNFEEMDKFFGFTNTAATILARPIYYFLILFFIVYFFLF